MFSEDPADSDVFVCFDGFPAVALGSVDGAVVVVAFTDGYFLDVLVEASEDHVDYGVGFAVFCCPAGDVVVHPNV